MKIAGHSPKPPIPTEKRRSFFIQQSRHRTQAKAWTFSSGIVGFLLVWALCFVVLGALILYTNFLSRLLPYQLAKGYSYLMQHAGGIIGLSVAAVLATAGLWWFAHRILTRDTSAGLVWRSAARLPDAEEIEEQEFVHLTKQMANASGAFMPALLLYDGPELNAALIGDRSEAAGILASRELLRELTPGERQGVIAHLISSGVNGDLQLTSSLLRMCYMVGIAVLLLDLPFSPGARKAIALLWRYSRQPDQESAAALNEAVAPALTRALQPDALESFTIVVRKLIGEETDLRSILGIVLLLPLFPVLLLRLAAGIACGVTSLCFLSPLVALILRSRRKLADKTALQLTGNADGVARALIRLYGAAHAIPQAGWSEMNFIIAHGAADARPFDRLRARVAEAISTANNFNHRLRDTTPSGTIVAPEPRPAGGSASHNFVFGFHPTLHTRIQELKKLGAQIAWSDRRDYSSWIIAAVPALVVGALLLIAFA